MSLLLSAPELDGAALATYASSRFRDGVHPTPNFDLHRRRRRVESLQRSQSLPLGAEIELRTEAPSISPPAINPSSSPSSFPSADKSASDASSQHHRLHPLRPAAVTLFGFSYRVHSFGLRHWRGQLEYGLRVGVATALSGAMATLIPRVDTSSALLSIPYVLVFFAVLATAPTVGQSLGLLVQLLQGIACTSILVYAAIKAGLGLGTRWQGGLTIFLLECFGLYVMRAQFIGKKTAGAIIVILVLLFVNNPNDQDPLLVWRLILEVIAGCGLAIALQLLLFPRFARLELHERWWYGWRLMERLITAALDAYAAAPDVQQLTAMRGAVRQLRTACTTNLGAIKTRALETRVEDALLPPLFTHWPFYRQYAAYPRMDPMMHVTWMEEVLSLVDNVVLCVESVAMSEYHAEFQDWMISALGDFARAAAAVTREVGEVRCDTTALADAQRAVVAASQRCFELWHSVRIKTYRPSPPPGVTWASDFAGEPPPVADSLTITFVDVENHFAFLTTLDMLAGALSSRQLIPPPGPFEPLPLLKRYATLLLMWPYTWRIHAADAKVAVKVAGILTVVSLPWLIQPSVIHFANGYWIPIAVAFSYADVYGQAVNTCLTRVLGTTVGACFGSLAVNAVLQQDTTQLHPLTRSRAGGLLALLFCWMVVCAPFRLHPRWFYAGTVAMFTAPIIAIGWMSYGAAFLSPGDLALARIQDNILGCLMYLVLDYLVLPTTATGKLLTLLQVNVANLDTAARGALLHYARVYEVEGEGSDVGAREEVVPVAQLRGMGEAAKGIVGQQAGMLPFTTWEPPLPQPHCGRLSMYQPEVTGLHQQLMELQGRITLLTHLLLSTTQRLRADSARDDLALLLGQLDAASTRGLVDATGRVRQLLARLFAAPNDHRLLQGQECGQQELQEAERALLSLEAAQERACAVQFHAMASASPRQALPSLYAASSMKTADYVASALVQSLLELLGTAKRLRGMQTAHPLLDGDLQ